jgi:hypothetical protein
MRGACPFCGATVAKPDGYDAIYTAKTKDGGRVTGGIYMTVCLSCGKELEAYESRDPSQQPEWRPEFKPPKSS